MEYVALSYVWGNVGQYTTNAEILWPIISMTRNARLHSTATHSY
jgi:hypothetical protein